jgi:hypothetical protein
MSLLGIQIVAFAFYRIVIYPTFVTSLRGLPMPKVCHPGNVQRFSSR